MLGMYQVCTILNKKNTNFPLKIFFQFAEEKKMEFLLTPNLSRFSLFPIVHKDIWKLYETHLKMFWIAQEVDLSHDFKHWNDLSDNERHFLKYVLAFFANADGIVLENLAQRFLVEIQIPEARSFYAMQQLSEAVHAHMYALLIDTYIKDQNEKMLLFHAVEKLPCVKAKGDWALKWLNSELTFAHRLVAFACVEGIFFSGSFCAIFWMKKRSKLAGLCKSNEFISRDEGLHVLHALLLYSKLQYTKLIQNIAHDIIKSCVEVEKSFICEAIPVSLIGMNQTLMSQYIEYVADWLCVNLGYDKIYHSTNPFDFMELLSLEGKTNFFENSVSEYSKTMDAHAPFSTQDDF